MVPEINGNYFNFPEFAVFYALTKICLYSDLCNFIETFVIWNQKKTARNSSDLGSSNASWISFTKKRSWLEQESPGQKPDWFAVMRLFEFK